MTIYQEQAGIRHYPISQRLTGVLNAAAAAAGIDGVHIFSGGQPSSGSARIGSHRHDLGNASDLSLSIRGRQLSENNPNDLPIIQRFFAAAKQNGATGFGAGQGYMGIGRYHVGFGTPAVWGPGESSANAPPWLVQAVGGGGGGRLLNDLIKFESGGRNITNVDATTSSGRARGFLQITDGTWRDAGRKFGVDFAQYPTAQSAPLELQLKVAESLPLKRWDPITLRKLTAAGHTFDVNKTLGENIAAQGGARSLSPETANLGPAPTGVTYGKDTTAGGPFAGATAQASTGTAPADGMSAFADSLASLFGGGQGGGGGTFDPNTPLPPVQPTDLGLQPGAAGAPPAPIGDTQAQMISPSSLANVFDQVPIGKAAPKVKTAQALIGTSWI
jgi:hypothetical protein